MKILSTNIYVGPNLYAHFPVIRHQRQFHHILISGLPHKSGNPF